jgi:methylated-DNA-[protein]-cysteine S-methyltransferase
MPRRVQMGEVPELGRVWLELDAEGAICSLHAPDLDQRKAAVPRDPDPLSPEIRDALLSHVRGDSRPLSALRLAPAPTTFAASVRQRLRAIPRGAVMTYGQIAQAIGKPGAARAVGRACASNPIPIVVPCHRVVAGESEGGFGWGVEAKRKLLALEGVSVHEGRIAAIVPDRSRRTTRGER